MTTPTSWDAVFAELVLAGIPGDEAELYAGTGMTSTEAREAHQAGLTAAGYTTARRAGASHAEVMVVYLIGGPVPVTWYTQARRTGAGHDQACTAARVLEAVGVPAADILAAHREGCDLGGYSRSRKAGATHTETVEARREVRWLDGYAWCRWAGATHTETVEARREGCELGGYAEARRAGASHGEVLDAHREGCELGGYADARRVGVSHAEAVDAHRGRMTTQPPF